MLSPKIPASSIFGPNSTESLVVRIEVVDTGVGISPRDVGGLFSAYVQTEAGLSQGGKGVSLPVMRFDACLILCFVLPLQTGLGLSLVRQIVSLSGGRLGVKSRVGAGTTMWVELPYGIGTTARESIHELDFAQSDKLARVLETPKSYADGDEQVEFDFLSTPPLLRKTSIRPLLRPSPTRRERVGSDSSAIPRTPHRSNTAPATSVPSDIVLTLPPPHSTAPGSYFDHPVTSRPTGPVSPSPSAIAPPRPGLVRAPTMKALEFQSGPVSFPLRAWILSNCRLYVASSATGPDRRRRPTHAAFDVANGTRTRWIIATGTVLTPASDGAPRMCGIDR